MSTAPTDVLARKHGFGSYSDYLNSPQWISKRDAIRKRDNNRCRKCKTPHNLIVHHKKYVGFPYNEPDKNLVTLCRGCHNIVHARTSWDAVTAVARLAGLWSKRILLVAFVLLSVWWAWRGIPTITAPAIPDDGTWWDHTLFAAAIVWWLVSALAAIAAQAIQAVPGLWQQLA